MLPIVVSSNRNPHKKDVDLKDQQDKSDSPSESESNSKAQLLLQTQLAKKTCISCDGMKDFVSNLQEEISRLNNLTADL